jgi:hypothetical protein
MDATWGIGCDSSHDFTPSEERSQRFSPKNAAATVTFKDAVRR